MKTLSEKLNFSQKEIENSFKIDKRKDVNFYETLCAYCANYDINLKNVTDEDFDSAVEILKNYGSNHLEFNHYFFSIN